MTTISYLESKRSMPLMELPVRTTVVRLQNKTLLISPGSGLTVDQLKTAGSVTDIIAPNLLHTAGMPMAAQQFPNAKLWGPPGSKQARPELNWTGLLEPASWPFENELALFALQGVPQLNEFVFYHFETKTLIVTDLCFHMANPKGWGAWLILNLFGTYRRLGVSKFFLRFAKDRPAFEASLQPLLQLPFENLAMAHGDLICENAKPRLRDAFIERGLLRG